MTASERCNPLALPDGNLKERSVRGGTVILAAQAIGFFLRFGSVILLARLLTPADFGLVAMIAPIRGLAGLLKDLGLAQAVIQRPKLVPGELTNLFWINSAITVALTLMLVALAPWVADFYGEPRARDITYVSAAMVLIGGFSALNVALLSRQMRFKDIAIPELAALAAGIAVGIVLAWQLESYWALIAMQFVTICTESLLMWWRSGWTPSWPNRQHDVRSMVRFGRNVAGFRILNYIASNVDRVLIGKAWGIDALGLYDRATRLLLLPTGQINRPLGRIALPLLSRLQDEPQRYRRAYQGLLGLVLFAATPGIAWATVTAPWLIPTVLGPQWVGLDRLFVWLALASIVRVATVTTGFLYISQDRTDELIRWGFVSAFGRIAAIVAGLPWGVYGVVVSFSLVTIFVLAPFQIWLGTRRGPVRAKDFVRVVLPFCVGLSVFFVLALGVISQLGLQQLIVPLVMLPGSYLVCILALLPFAIGRRILLDVVELRLSLLKPRSLRAAASLES